MDSGRSSEELQPRLSLNFPFVGQRSVGTTRTVSNQLREPALEEENSVEELTVKSIFRKLESQKISLLVYS